ncbi:EGF domain-specific O-linked N-acetylglucosamine transferase [Lachnellula suecica]|uniref:EGF domain-specific O-linked N-acetylglucosamine transferase n=1 Tax=Lachnellula suecica TaxID=602035 RepID=A0A8T9C2N5_9HELO|nr:EGF domain-specific O-linked N-acetylglucosamine transferase [Lachnellula suecica]
MAGPISLKRRYSLLLSSACLGLLVVYYMYSAGEITVPSFVAGGRESLQDVDAKLKSGAAALTLPAEYSTTNAQKCELFFTPSYLQHIATHQLPYCEAQSSSAFHCFTAPRLSIPLTEGWGETDPLCVAQGVSFHPGRAGADRDFHLQCKLRDLVTERARFPEAAKELEGFRDKPTDWGWYWGDTGVGASLNTWNFEDPGDVTGCTRENINHSDWVILMRRDSTDTHNLWHKLMEILQARHSLDALRIAINPATGLPWLSEQDAAGVQLIFDDDREELLEPLWEIVTGGKPIRKSSLQQPTCFGNVILPLPGCGSPFWSNLLDTGHPEQCLSQTLLTTFVHRVFEFYGIAPRPVTEIHKHPTITIVERKENRKFIAVDHWTASLKERWPDSPINVVDFASITIEEQIKLAQSTDILVGHHGAAMAHIIFMSPGTTAVEILPRNFDQHGFRSIAAMRGITYIAGRGLYEEEYENAVNSKPLPQNWPPPPPQGFNHWQNQEWTYMTDKYILNLIDSAVISQKNRLGSSNL